MLFPIALPVSLLLCWLSFHFFEEKLIVLGHRWAKQVKSKGEQPQGHQPLQPSVVQIGTE